MPPSPVQHGSGHNARRRAPRKGRAAPGECRPGKAGYPAAPGIERSLHLDLFRVRRGVCGGPDGEAAGP